MDEANINIPNFLIDVKVQSIALGQVSICLCFIMIKYSKVKVKIK